MDDDISYAINHVFWPRKLPQSGDEEVGGMSK